MLRTHERSRSKQMSVRPSAQDILNAPTLLHWCRDVQTSSAVSGFESVVS